MTQKRTDAELLPPEEKEIDRTLAELAENVPEMPADFHENWMKAVREEAEKKPAAVSQWPRILSMAAVFVLLIGGVLLARNREKDPDPQAFRTDAAMKAAETRETNVMQTAESAVEAEAEAEESAETADSMEARGNSMDEGNAPMMNAMAAQPEATAGMKAEAYAEDEMAAPLVAAGYEMDMAAEEEAPEAAGWIEELVQKIIEGIEKLTAEEFQT